MNPADQNQLKDGCRNATDAPVITLKKRFHTISGIIQPVKIALFLFLALTVCLSCKTDSRNNGSPISENIFPRLIITAQNKDDYIRKSKTSHKHLFDLAIQLAGSFSAEEPPAGLTAANSNRRIGETMPSLGLAYLMTGQAGYLKAAEKWISAVLEVPSWDGSQNLGRCAWVTGVAQLYDWLYHDLEEDFKARIVQRLVSEAGIISETASRTRALSNHLMIEAAAVGTVGLILSEENHARLNLLDTAKLWTEYIIRNAPLDGSWGEGVQYWEYGLGYFLRYLEGCYTSGYHDYFIEYDWLKKTGRFPLHFSVPDNLTRVINFGDCGTDRYIPSFLCYLPASRYRDPVVQDYAVKIQATKPHKLSWVDFLMFDATLPPVDYRTVEKTFHHFDDHGFVAMRSGWNEDATLVGFRCGPAPGHANQVKPDRVANRGFGPGHQHPDINSFIIYGNGTWLAIDPGYIQIKETRNHNTLLVNGYGQAGAGSKWLDFMAFESREPAPAITFTETTPDVDYIIGNAGNIYVDEAGLDLFERQVMFVKPDIVIVADRLRASRASDFSWLLQANEIADIREVSGGFDIRKNEAALSVHPVLPSGLVKTVSQRMLQADNVYGVPNDNRREGLLRTISLDTKGNKADYVVVMAVNKPGESRPAVTMDNGILTIAKGERVYQIRYQPEKPVSQKVLDLTAN